MGRGGCVGGIVSHSYLVERHVKSEADEIPQSIVMILFLGLRC